MRFLVVLLFVAGALAGCLDETPAPDDVVAEAAPVEPARADAVVAFIDTGINVYHKTFRDDDPRSWDHPSTYLPGYPEDALPLEVTLDEDDYWEAVRADCEDVWAHVEPGQLYYVPGTKIVGAIYLDGRSGADCGPEQPIVRGILDRGAHGTMVASRGTSVEYGACTACKTVAIQGFSEASTAWAAEQAHWIDAQSNSWGPFLPVPLVGVSESLFTPTPTFARTVEAAAQEHLSFWASGNGALTRFGAVGHPTLIDPRMTPSIVMVGGHDSGQVNVWPDFPPHVVSDACNSWAAYPASTHESAEDVGGGTSGASPFAAGGAARMLLEARTLLGHTGTGIHDGVVAKGDAGVAEGPLADGELTLDEWKELVLKTASPRPERQHEDGSVCDAVSGLVLYSATPVAWKDVPEAYPEYVHIGYGAVDDAAQALALEVLGGAPLPDRSATDAYFAMDADARQAFHDAYTGLPG